MANPPVSTATTIIQDALEIAGVIGDGETPSAEDINKNFVRMNDMLAQWQRERFLIWHLVDVPLVSTGAVSYSVGPGGAFNITRPDRLENGNFVRLLNTAPPNQVDYPLTLIESWEDWSRVTMKQMGTFPGAVFYDSGSPLGTAYVWPVPQASLYEIHLLVKATLAQFATPTSQFTFPPEYAMAIKYRLARLMRAAYRLPADPEINAIGRDALNTIRKANVQVATLTMPAPLQSGTAYNIYSDRF